MNGNNYELVTEQFNSLMKEMQKIHSEILQAGYNVISDVNYLKMSKVGSSPALENYFNFFETVEHDVLRPTLIFSSRLYKGLHYAKTEIYNYDKFER